MPLEKVTLNMQSVWLCSRNDAIWNVAVIFAAIGVFGTGQFVARHNHGWQALWRL